jgi:hypothetical protein
VQKKFMYIVGLTAILGMLFGVAAAPAVTKSLVLEDVRFISGKGYVFLFSATGNFKQNELSGFVNIGNDGFDLACKLRDDGKVSCVAFKLSPSYTGRQAVVHLAGFVFYPIIPGLPCISLDVSISIYNASTGDLFYTSSINIPLGYLDLIKSLINDINSNNPGTLVVLNSASCSPKQPDISN